MATTDGVGPASPGDARVQIESLERLVAQLEQGLQSRIVIEQAKGVLSERHRLPPDEAFALLRRAARNQQRKIHDVATELVASTCPSGSVAG